MREAIVATMVITLGILLSGCEEAPPDTPPRQLDSMVFHYPQDLWDAGTEGETLLELHVSPEGAVDSAQVQRTSGHPAFDSAAVRGARDLQFEPARRGDANVRVRVLLPVQFQRNPPASAPPPQPVEP